MIHELTHTRTHFWQRMSMWPKLGLSIPHPSGPPDQGTTGVVGCESPPSSHVLNCGAVIPAGLAMVGPTTWSWSKRTQEREASSQRDTDSVPAEFCHPCPSSHSVTQGNAFPFLPKLLKAGFLSPAKKKKLTRSKLHSSLSLSLSHAPSIPCQAFLASLWRRMRVT